MPEEYHEILAVLGASSAHPGGFAESLRMLSNLKLESTHKHLDIGCGTGRTTCWIADTYQCESVGLDSHPVMVERASKRAKLSGSKAHFVHGDAGALPYPDNHFDLVTIESVLLFQSKEMVNAMLKEARRVLKPGGRLINNELCRQGEIPEENVRALYGIQMIPTHEEWKEAFELAGFSNMDMKKNDFSFFAYLQQEIEHPDPVPFDSEPVKQSTGLNDFLQRNALFFSIYAEQLGYVTVIAMK